MNVSNQFRFLGLAVTIAALGVAVWLTPAMSPTVAADQHNCSDYPTQAAAQAALRRNPSDPNGLDKDQDGIACETNPGARDVTRVSRTGAAVPAGQPAPAPRAGVAMPSTGTGIASDRGTGGVWLVLALAVTALAMGRLLVQRR